VLRATGVARSGASGSSRYASLIAITLSAEKLATRTWHSETLG